MQFGRSIRSPNTRPTLSNWYYLGSGKSDLMSAPRLLRLYRRRSCKSVSHSIDDVMLAPIRRTDTLPAHFMELAHEIAHTVRCRHVPPTNDGAVSAGLRASYSAKRKSQPGFRGRKSGKDWVDFEEAVASVEYPHTSSMIGETS